MEETGFISIAYRKAERIMPNMEPFQYHTLYGILIPTIQNWRCKNIKKYMKKAVKNGIIKNKSGDIKIKIIYKFRRTK